MESKIRLSILIASIPERLDRLQEVIAKYEYYIEKHKLEGVEILSIVDNKKRSIGAKRFDLAQLAQGEFLVWVDDDDELTEKYFENIFIYIVDEHVEVVTYKQLARIDHNYTFVHFGLRRPNDHLVPSNVTIRMAWTCCTWRKSIVTQIKFGDTNWGEDSEWASAANKVANNEHHINEICHIYQHDSETTAAFQEKPV